MAKSIMLQGTMSNVGKSLLTAALCRIFTRDGYKTAPFKSQNMALNSFITGEGLEIGRAQAMQAEAAGIEPCAAMNPVLLKPTTDVGSQVIVMGEVVGNMTAREYFKYKKQLVPTIKAAYDSLASENDIIVIEGAGSPAEINLKADDIVNMGVAKMTNSPVLLIGDIDRGGVFAQLLGTVDLLEEDEKRLVKGLIVNKFRGDKSLLRSGVDILEQRSGKPVLGVVPYIKADIDDEDSLSERFDRHGKGVIDIAVIRLAHISNFTDLTALECIDGVGLRYVSRAGELGRPDMVILPGTKSTMADMKILRENGLEAAIKRLADGGTPVFGICGGFQLLGEEISDPCGTEGGGSICGMGLLPVKTVFSPQKTRTRTSGVFKNAGGVFSGLNGESFEGYEIHMGETDSSMSLLENGKYDGMNIGNIYGTYIHGIFDAKGVSEKIISALADKKGVDMDGIRTFNMKEYKNSQYDILANAVRQSLDMDRIYKIIGEGV
ncbi:MAG: cobyric acid synthase [Firmicutes bacterium]|nr:cobyric acid synthase [Bacillota bacterium]